MEMAKFMIAFSKSSLFKIDLIVWKYDSGGSFESATSTFKIDLIVWKFG